MREDDNQIGGSHLALAIGRLEGRMHEFTNSITASVDRIGRAQGETGKDLEKWKADTIRLQEQTKTRATLAAILAIVIPVVLVFLLRYLEAPKREVRPWTDSDSSGRSSHSSPESRSP